MKFVISIICLITLRRKELDRFKEMEDNLEKEMRVFAENTEELKEDFSNLLTIKCIGVISA